MAAETKPETWDNYQVFLSFRGPDTRQSFTDCLYHFMTDAGIRVFRDDDELSIGQPIDTILSAIENSKICMPVFSPTFASSPWCLREVAKMVELRKEVAPIFFGVTPDDVKLRTSVYRDFMGKHELKYGKDQVKQWEDALKEVATIKGRELKEKGYYEFSKELTREVLIKLKPNKKHVPSNLIGMDDQVETVLKLLDTKSSGIRCVGIYGMGGIGKTTLAEILFNKLSATFDCCAFLPDVRESLRRNGLEHLQKSLLWKLEPRLKDTDHIVDPVTMIMETFRRRKGKEAIVGLRLERPQPNSMEEVLAGLHNVRYLSLEAAKFSKRFKHPLPELKWLSLPRCPASFNPYRINISKLVILELPHSSISEKWNGWRYIQPNWISELSHPLENANALPTSFVGLSQLEILEVYCEHLKCIPMLPSSLRRLVLDEFNLGVILPDISCNRNLEYLCLNFSQKVLKYDNFPQLPVSLRELRIFSPASLPDLTNLKDLRKFVLAGGASLKEIQGIGKLESLEELDIGDCKFLESLENLSELRNLKRLSIFGCPKLRVIEGLERLPLVQKDVHLGDCKCAECLPAESTSRPECLPAESTSRPSRRRQLVSLVVSKLGIPHSDLPSWIQQYLERKGTDEGHRSLIRQYLERETGTDEDKVLSAVAGGQHKDGRIWLGAFEERQVFLQVQHSSTIPA
ncbi:hypothetical protein CRG98_013405 [Punica granatum]|uniref:TIR domain-containing protein n=1 Tax=Punica granatum TaxID=22663 RepID=A0A2I0KCH6_PUNGR|nr:hypothetical protein CRG98_013405 [Punica granatum]